jgi:hypothetical protein
MALSLEEAVRVKQKCRAESRKPKVQGQLKALFSYISQHLGSPNLQFEPFTDLSSSASAGVVADAPCKLYGLFIQSPAASAIKSFVKFTDDETTASATVFEVGVGMQVTKQEFLAWPDGKPFANGIMARGDTTMEASTGSAAADRVSGFAIIGGP